MQTLWQFLRRLWDRFQKQAPSASHPGGQGIPTILGVCEDCGAIVIEGLHRPTATGYLCQRCAASSRH